MATRGPNPEELEGKEREDQERYLRELYKRGNPPKDPPKPRKRPKKTYKRGGGMISPRSKVMQGYKKGGQV